MTPLYTPPEIIKNEPHGFKVDVWAAGIILYFICSGSYPFDEHPYPSRIMIIGSPHKELRTASCDMNDLINKLLTKNPDHRPNIDEVL